MKLTPDQITLHCKELLEPITRYITTKMGPEATTHTAGCLFEALCKYDSSKSGNLTAWARGKTRNLVIEQIRVMEGRKGTARHAALSSRDSFEDFDAPIVDVSPIDAMEVRESLQEAFKEIENSRYLSQVILMGRFLGNFTDRDIGKLVNADTKQIQREADHLRRLLPDDRFPDAVRRRN